MGAIRDRLHAIRDSLLESKAPGIHTCLAILYSVSASVGERRFCRVSHKDDLWLHSWPDGAVIFEKPTRRPKSQTEVLFPLFFFDFSPRLGDVVVDIGAGVGSDAVEFAKRVGPTGRVICIEAHPRTAMICQRLVDHLQLHNVQVIHAAVTDQAGDVWITDDAMSIGNHLSSNGLRVRGERLDVLLEEVGVARADFAKVNIEGAERSLLMGLVDSPLKIQRWCISCHDFIDGDDFATFEGVCGWLSDNSYEVRVHPPIEAIPSARYYVYGSR